MEIQLTGHNVLVEYYTNEGVTRSGLYVAEPEWLPQYRAQVIALGPDVDQPVEVGDDVIFQHHAGEPIKDGAKTLYILNEDDIHVVLHYSED